MLISSSGAVEPARLHQVRPHRLQPGDPGDGDRPACDAAAVCDASCRPPAGRSTSSGVTATWAEATITWNNQPFGTTLNNPPSGSRTDSFDIGTPVGCQNLTANAYIVGAIVTSDVATFVAGSATNFGWMLRDDVEASATARSSTYATKNLGTVNQAPQLVITYVTVP